MTFDEYLNKPDPMAGFCLADSWSPDEQAAARQSWEASMNAPWIAQAHQLCTDQGIEQGHIGERLTKLRAMLTPTAEPMFWVRLLRDGLYEGPVHHKSAEGKMLRDAKPGEWHPLYLAAPSGQQAEQFLEVPDVEDESGINTHYSRDLVLQCIDAALSRQAPAAPAEADPLQGAADWLKSAIVGVTVGDLQRNLLIGYNRAKRLFDTAPTPAEPAQQDTRTVPVEPTPEMLDKGAMEIAMNMQRVMTAERKAENVYRAMLRASPQAPSGQQAEPTDEQIIAAARTAKAKHWSLRDEDCVLIGRAVLALTSQQSERPAPDAYNRRLRAQLAQEWAGVRRLKAAYERPAPAGQAEPWQAINDADLRTAEQFLMNHTGKAAFFPIDAQNLANIAMHCIREVRATRAAAPAGQAVGDELDLIESVLQGYPRSMAQADALRTITKLRAMLAASQAERPANNE